MNKVIGKIHELIFDYTTKRNIRRMERLADEVAHRLQIREFNGGWLLRLTIYPSYLSTRKATKSDCFRLDATFSNNTLNKEDHDA